MGNRVGRIMGVEVQVLCSGSKISDLGSRVRIQGSRSSIGVQGSKVLSWGSRVEDRISGSGVLVKGRGPWIECIGSQDGVQG